jgi:RHS repeat-associated protein
MLTYGDFAFTYTDNGELETKQDTVTGDLWQYEYDARGNLRGVTLPNGDVITYLVDGMGRRVGKELNGVLVQGWLWRDQLQPVAETDGAGNVVAVFVYAEGENVPELMVTAGATYRLVKDHLGSVRQVVDVSTGVVAQEIVYDAWGRVLADTNPGFQPFGYAGGQADVDAGIVRFGARDYDPTSGRWLAKDPLGLAADGNVFAYSSDDPLNHRDTSGRFGEDLLQQTEGLPDIGPLIALGIFAATALEDCATPKVVPRTKPDFAKCHGNYRINVRQCCEEECDGWYPPIGEGSGYDEESGEPVQVLVRTGIGELCIATCLAGGTSFDDSGLGE